MSGRKPVSMYERFMEKVDKTSTCWNWTANTNNKGYGMFSINKAIGKKLAHRISFELHGGEIPNGACVLHRCDNPACVNPDHLFLGTHRDNMRDKELKGRANHKGRHGNAIKFSDADQMRILTMRKSGLSLKTIGAEFGCDKGVISRFLKKRCQRDVGNVHVKKFSDQDTKAIITMRQHGTTLREIAEVYGVDRSVVKRILDSHGVSVYIKPGPRTT